MKKLKLISLLSTLCVFCLYSQDNLGARVILSTDRISNASYYVYDPPFKATKIYNSLSEINNEYPEKLMSSILSASSQEWVNYNTLGGEENADKKADSHFENVKSLNIEKTFFELYSKLLFKVNGSEIAILKFYLHDERKKNPIAGATVMENVEGRWYKTQKPYTTPIAMALMIFKADVMEHLVKNQPVNDLEKKLLSEVYSSGLDFEKLLKVNLNDEEKEYFTNPLNW